MSKIKESLEMYKTIYDMKDMTVLYNKVKAIWSEADAAEFIRRLDVLRSTTDVASVARMCKITEFDLITSVNYCLMLISDDKEITAYNEAKNSESEVVHNLMTINGLLEASEEEIEGLYNRIYESYTIKNKLQYIRMVSILRESKSLKYAANFFSMSERNYKTVLFRYIEEAQYAQKGEINLDSFIGSWGLNTGFYFMCNKLGINTLTEFISYIRTNKIELRIAGLMCFDVALKEYKDIAIKSGRIEADVKKDVELLISIINENTPIIINEQNKQTTGVQIRHLDVKDIKALSNEEFDNIVNCIKSSYTLDKKEEDIKLLQAVRTMPYIADVARQFDLTTDRLQRRIRQALRAAFYSSSYEVTPDTNISTWSSDMRFIRGCTGVDVSTLNELIIYIKLNGFKLRNVGKSSFVEAIEDYKKAAILSGREPSLVEEDIQFINNAYSSKEEK